MTFFRASLDTIAEIVGATRPPTGGDTEVCAVATDTREPPRQSFVFIALRGPNFDGNAFLADAERAGAVAVVADRDPVSEIGIPVLRVPDGLEALQALAAWWRGHFQGPVVGITGSNGKTVVKEMANAILSGVRKTYRSPGSFNSQVGVALSVLRAPSDAGTYLFECGVSRRGEMARLEAIVRPDIGVLTNIGIAHLAGFGTSQNIAVEKLRLFRNLTGRLIAHESAGDYAASTHGSFELTLVGRDSEGWVRVHDSAASAHGFTLELDLPDGTTPSFNLPCHAAHDVDNAVCAAAVATALGCSPREIAAGLEAFSPAPLRIEVHTSTTGSNITLINDSYSADPVSMQSGLRTLARLAGDRRSIAVLGEMRDLGERSAEEHKEVGRSAAQLGVQILVVVGEGARPIASGATSAGLEVENVFWVSDPLASSELLHELLKPNDIVLVKASRPIQLEQVADQVLESMAPTRAYIDLSVIADNVRRLRAWMGPGVAAMAVVKSFGYGSDAERVSELLQNQGVDYLCVAYPDEGVLLRRRGIHVPILVSSVVPSEARKIVSYGLSAVCFTEEVLDALSGAAREAGRTVPVHVKVDTGMGRFGVEVGDAAAFAGAVAAREGLVLEGIMSHLAVADDPQQDPYTEGQIARFRRTVETLDEAGHHPRFVHLANSAGLWRFPNAHFNAVRFGLGLYGCLDCDEPAPGAPELSPAISLHSRIIGIREIEKDRSVGYGRTYKTDVPTRIGLVGLGYNDGLPWSVSNKAALWIRGGRVPIVGNVCMDVTMVDLNGQQDVQVGDDVIIYGTGEHGEPTVAEVARWAGTIPYEVLCRIGLRVQRIIRLAT